MGQGGLTRGLLAAVVLALALLGAACGNDEGDGDGEAAGPADFGDDAGAFNDLLAHGSEVAVEVAYSVIDSASDAEVNLTVVQDPPQWAMIVEADEGPVSWTIVDEEGGITNCTPTEDDWRCMGFGERRAEDTPGIGPGFIGPQLLDDADDLAEEGWSEPVSETIAGRSALCATGEFTRDPDEDDEDGEATEGTTEVCVDDRYGVVLRAITEHDDRTNGIEAQDFSDEPDTSMFEAPAEAMDLGNAGRPDADELPDPAP